MNKGTTSISQIPSKNAIADGKGNVERGWLQWLSAIGDALAGEWGLQNPSVTSSTGTVESAELVRQGAVTQVTVTVNCSGDYTAPTSISGIPKAQAGAILQVVLLDGSGNLMGSAPAWIAPGSTTATISSAATGVTRVCVSGTYRTR